MKSSLLDFLSLRKLIKVSFFLSSVASLGPVSARELKLISVGSDVAKDVLEVCLSVSLLNRLFPPQTTHSSLGAFSLSRNV